jgi:SNF2 family DNA or RNA helicase
VFSQYVKTLQWLAGELNGMPSRIFHGELSIQEREDTISWFRKSPGPLVLLVSLKAGGVGLNLQEASTVVMFDRWWNPATEDQAIQRAHRFGRKRPLHVFRFLVDNTIEERIDDLIKDKKNLFKKYVEDAKNAEIKALPSAALWRILNIAPELFSLPISRKKESHNSVK